MIRRGRRTAAIVTGVLLGAAATTLVVAGLVTDDDSAPACVRSVESDRSIARDWNEAVLAAIRSDFPAPTIHSRNLYHSSAAMWDAWAAYDPVALGVFVDEKHTADDVTTAREEAMSYAAYRILVARYLPSPRAELAVTQLDDLMDALCYDRSVTRTDGDSPAAFGNRIAETILAFGLTDGSNEANGYVADYQPVNPPLPVDRPGTEMNDPNRWQPLELDVMVAQNGLPLDDTVQVFVGPHWGHVTSFALPPADADGLTDDPGPPPLLGDPSTDGDFKLAANEVIRYSATLDPSGDAVIDISPGANGNRPIGSYDAAGHELNPVTGAPYEPNVVALGDYGRVIAEFWADGPMSETPPGHWNSIANFAIDDLARRGPLRIADDGPEVDRLEYDVKLYLALNGAVHDAAIAAWGAKGHYDYVRPISMIRYMGGLGQSSDPAGSSYDPDGLLLEPGLVEVISEASSSPGQRHEALADHVGEIAVRAWQGEPGDIEGDIGGVGWIRAVEWVPYQRATFVTPAFAGYVSGHSAFSRAAAVVLSEFTGSPYFPGGLGEWRIEPDELEFEAGPAAAVTLQWATYADASDEAGRLPAVRRHPRARRRPDGPGARRPSRRRRLVVGPAVLRRRRRFLSRNAACPLRQAACAGANTTGMCARAVIRSSAWRPRTLGENEIDVASTAESASSSSASTMEWAMSISVSVPPTRDP